MEGGTLKEEEVITPAKRAALFRDAKAEKKKKAKKEGQEEPDLLPERSRKSGGIFGWIASKLRFRSEEAREEAYLEQVVDVIEAMMRFDSMGGTNTLMAGGKGNDSGYLTVTVPPDLSPGITEKMRAKLITALNELGVEYSIPLVRQATNSGESQKQTMDGTFLLLLRKNIINDEGKHAIDPLVVEIRKRVRDRLGITDALDLATFQMIVHSGGDEKIPVGLRIQFPRDAIGAEQLATTLKKKCEAEPTTPNNTSATNPDYAFIIRNTDKMQKFLVDVAAEGAEPKWGKPLNMAAFTKPVAGVSDPALPVVTPGKYAAAARQKIDTSKPEGRLQEHMQSFKDRMKVIPEYVLGTEDMIKLHLLVPVEEIDLLRTELVALQIKVSPNSSLQENHVKKLQKVPGTDPEDFRRLVVDQDDKGNANKCLRILREAARDCDDTPPRQ